MRDFLAEELDIEPLSEKQLIAMDQYIDKVKLNRHLYNENQTGINNNHYGHKHSEETKKLLSEKAKNRPKIFGRKHTQETKDKISNSKKGIKPNRDYSNPWNKGLKLGPRKNGI